LLSWPQTKSMKNTFRIICFASLAIAIVSCGSAARKSRPVEIDDPRTGFETKLGEIGLLEDEGVVTTGVPEAADLDDSNPVHSTPGRIGDSSEDGQIFSAQIFASKSSSEAREYKESVESLFSDEVRIDYQAPYYKVCVGRVQGFDEAQKLLERVNAIGFSRAWLVKLRK